MRKLEAEIMGLPDLPNRIRYRAWFVVTTHNKKWLRKVREAFPFYSDPPMEKFKIKFERHSSRQPDFDNLVGSYKPVLDALVKIGILKDDGPKHMEESNYKWFKCTPKNGHIVIRIEEC